MIFDPCIYSFSRTPPRSYALSLIVIDYVISSDMFPNMNMEQTFVSQRPDAALIRAELRSFFCYD